jgi:diacylglycerol kinase family enzyme
MQPALLVLNPHAGQGRLARWVRARAPALARSHPGLRLHEADDPRAAEAAVRALPRGQRVIVAGGDGSVQRLLAALVDGGHELALLPGGHGDDLARALGLRGLKPEAALSLALNGRAQPIDLGRFTPQDPPGGAQWFASSLCAGLDAAIAARATALRMRWHLPLPRSWAGLSRYLRATLKEVAQLQPTVLQVRADGRPVHDGPALFASVLNTATSGAGLRAAPRAQPDDGQLDLVLAGAFSRLGVLAMLPRLMAGTHGSHPRVGLLPLEVLQVHAERPLPLAADGEALPAAQSWRVQVHAHALRVVAPSR